VLFVRAAHANRSAADCVLIAVTLPHIKLLPESGVPVPSALEQYLAQASTSYFELFVLGSRFLAFYGRLKRATQHVVVGNCVLSD